MNAESIYKTKQKQKQKNRMELSPIVFIYWTRNSLGQIKRTPCRSTFTWLNEKHEESTNQIDRRN